MAWEADKLEEWEERGVVSEWQERRLNDMA